jgi:hypothetical protein
MIADFVIDKMSSYIAAGTLPKTAARQTCIELEAIYRGTHYSRDFTGRCRVTPLPENLDLKTAMTKCDWCINEVLKCCNEKKQSTEAEVKKIEFNIAPAIPKNVYHKSAAIKQTITAGIGIKDFFAKGADHDPTVYTTDIEKIAAMWNEGKRRFKGFIKGRFFVIDVDRKPGKPDGLVNFYRIFPKETLPYELQNLPESFPCYVASPSGGFHLYFKHEGAELELRELAPGVELKEYQITPAGSSKENGDYVLHGDFNDAPPLYGLIIDAIEETKRKKEQTKTERTKPKTTHPAPVTRQRITLDDLALEAVTACAGNHDRQVSFSGRACRCKFPISDTLLYVKSRSDIFGNDTDTENTIVSVFRDYGAA